MALEVLCHANFCSSVLDCILALLSSNLQPRVHNDPIFCMRFRNHLISRIDFLISDRFPDFLLISN